MKPPNISGSLDSLFCRLGSIRWPPVMGVLLVLTATVTLGLYHFSKTVEYLDVGGDGFVYLTMAKHHFYDPIRTPLTALFILPEIISARLEMLLLHTAITLLLYLLGWRLSGDWLAGLIASFLYGVNWWFIQFTNLVQTDLPAALLILLTVTCLLPTYRGSSSRLSASGAGVLSALASLLRPQYFLAALLITLLLLYKRRFTQTKWYLALYTITVGPLELLADLLAFEGLVYTPYEFFKVNLLEALPSKLYAGRSLEYFVWRLLRNPLYDSIFRWFLVLGLPLMLLVAAWLYVRLTSRWRRSSVLLLTLLLLSPYLSTNVDRTAGFSYPTFRADLVEYPDTPSVSSNLPTLVRYFNGENAFYIFEKEGYLLKDLETAREVISRYKYLVLFRYESEFTPFSLLTEVEEYALENLLFIKSFDVGVPTTVYMNPKIPALKVDWDFSSPHLPVVWQPIGAVEYHPLGFWELHPKGEAESLARLVTYYAEHNHYGGLNLTFTVFFSEDDVHKAIEITDSLERHVLVVKKDGIFWDGETIHRYLDTSGRWIRVGIEAYHNERIVSVRFDGVTYPVELPQKFGRIFSEGFLLQMSVAGSGGWMGVGRIQGELYPSPSQANLKPPR